MSREHRYEVTVRWTGETTSYRAYARDHDVEAAGKPTITATADPAFLGAADRWNPEDLLVASLSQCHLLTYLSVCARAGVVVTGYVDNASGTMQEDAAHGGRFTEVVLRPEVTVAEESMREKAAALHHDAHDQCFIANSVNFPVRHVPVVR
ncbi:Organic hydroperoxide reductase OsmC/OhrA [Amycolatopsis pretoriensis]|uniref:Organic hydroperoxide reductase OsmC/OhrA n=1 Tax=Amycolatopsis pretoriensis TaxID=218821 RepID=A0A1H5QLX1_9PSEU|nr:OsmC family protein [Amycolatopsis pretoriensis]SEF27110.1 Organic hydroperoxide reductase OsmC/OhrA [Amycolatopsis pretoriensis]